MLKEVLYTEGKWQLDENLNLNKLMKSTGNGKYLDKCKYFLPFNFLKLYLTLNLKTKEVSCGVHRICILRDYLCCSIENSESLGLLNSLRGHGGHLAG